MWDTETLDARNLGATTPGRQIHLCFPESNFDLPFPRRYETKEREIKRTRKMSEIPEFDNSLPKLALC